jgi:hypothetical protein
MLQLRADIATLAGSPLVIVTLFNAWALQQLLIIHIALCYYYCNYRYDYSEPHHPALSSHGSSSAVGAGWVVR